MSIMDEFSTAFAKLAGLEDTKVSEAKWTKGPWYLGDASPDIKAQATVRADGWDVAHCFGDKATECARLIAAAPDLYEALEEILACHRDGTFGADGFQGFKLAEAALAKARGDDQTKRSDK